MPDIPGVCCAGEVMLEFSPVADSALFRQSVAGDTFNTAVYLSRAGIPVRFLTALGAGAMSDTIAARMREEGIDDSLVRRVPGREPGLYLIRNDDRGERTFSYWRGQSPVRELFDDPVTVEGVDLLYLSGITLAVCRSGLANLARLLEQVRRHKGRVAFDPNFRPALWDSLSQARSCYQQILPLCDVVLPTLEDEALLWGLTSVEACRDFYQGHGIPETVIKTPDLCVHASTAVECAVIKAEPVAAVDTTGAGDAFAAGYLGARLQGASLQDAVVAGQRLAARVVRCPGAILPAEQEGA